VAVLCRPDVPSSQALKHFTTEITERTEQLKGLHGEEEKEPEQGSSDEAGPTAAQRDITHACQAGAAQRNGQQ
jgi:hypothetical protein